VPVRPFPGRAQSGDGAASPARRLGGPDTPLPAGRWRSPGAGRPRGPRGARPEGDRRARRSRGGGGQQMTCRNRAGPERPAGIALRRDRPGRRTGRRAAGGITVAASGPARAPPSAWRSVDSGPGAGDVQQSVCCTPAVQTAVYPAVQYSPVGDGCETKNTLDPRFSFLYCTADPETGSPAGPSVPVVSCTPGSVLLHTSSSISPDIAPPSEMSPFRPLPTCSAGCTAGVQQGQLLYTVAVRDTVSTSLRRGRTACEDVHAARRQHRRGGGRDRRRTAQGARRRPAKKEGGGLRGS
jgi:hypothetical protein